MSEPLIFQKLRLEAPNPRQREFFLSTAAHTAYGGARGGGKSWAMRRKMVMLAMRYPRLRLLLLRRTLSELRENHLLPLQSELLPKPSSRSVPPLTTFQKPKPVRLW